MKPEEALIAEACGALALSLSLSQQEIIAAYAGLLESRAVGLGLIAPGDAGRILSRHVLDSLRGAAVVRDSDRRAHDLGSGAGLPGIPVAIACPWLTVSLAEARRRRAAFLELAVQELGLANAPVRWRRVEQLPESADICFARALAPLPRAWDLARALLVPGGRLVHFMGGAQTRLPDLPGCSAAEVLSLPLLDSVGPLAIITR